MRKEVREKIKEIKEIDEIVKKQGSMVDVGEGSEERNVQRKEEYRNDKVKDNVREKIENMEKKDVEVRQSKVEEKKKKNDKEEYEEKKRGWV